MKNPGVKEKINKAYIDRFGYVAPAKTKTIVVDSDGDINKLIRVNGIVSLNNSSDFPT